MSEDNKLIARALSTMTLAQIECYLDNVDKLEKVLYEPPTADEVCKALSEYLRLDKFNSKCIFEDNNFYERCDDGVLETIIDNDNGLIDIYFNLPPHLITLIGRFYEGEIK